MLSYFVLVSFTLGFMISFSLSGEDWLTTSQILGTTLTYSTFMDPLQTACFSSYMVQHMKPVGS